MAFPSIAFAYFFLLVASVGWGLRNHRTAQKIFLLAASYVFYGAGDLWLMALLAAVSFVDWGLAEAILATTNPSKRRALLSLGIAANVGLLCVFKLFDFFRTSTEAVARLLGLSAHLPVLEILAPIGVSFYVFQGLAYIIDAHRGTVYRARSLLDFLLFMAFFPKVLAGPICRSRELLPQFADDGPRAVPEPSRAFALVVTGLFKKVVLASALATHLVDEAFRSPGLYSSLELVVAVFAYSVQIYLDFSGYTDLARGLALLLGFRLPENFAAPYAATNLGEYWRRWHITFSTWLRDYVYFPLGGSRRPRLRVYLNLIITFAVCGLWHGSNWKFVIWGVAHGIGLATHKAILDSRRARGIDPKLTPSAWPTLLMGWLFTMTFCAVVRIPFRAADLEVAGEFITGMFRGTIYGSGLDPWVLVVTAIGFAMNFVGRPVFEALVTLHARLPALARPVAWIGTALVILLLKTHEVAPYIYFGF